jgi:tetratricopeptide (TPR) repeat protein
MESGTTNLLHMLEDRVRALCESGKFSEARKAGEAAIEKAREALSDDQESIAELALSLEVKGDLLRQIGEMEPARKDYLEALDLLDGNAAYTEQLGRISASTAVIYDHTENIGEAKRFYERSVELFLRLDPPAMLDIADLKNNLAFLYEAEGDEDRAETLFLDALKISHEELGKDDPETAAICNNLGALYQKTGHIPQAREMHSMALENRVAALGAKDPDTAQSHGNLAVALAESEQSGDARKHFESAVDIYEKHVGEHMADYATVVTNFTHFLKGIGDQKSATALEKRAGKVLKKG